MADDCWKRELWVIGRCKLRKVQQQNPESAKSSCNNWYNEFWLQPNNWVGMSLILNTFKMQLLCIGQGNISRTNVHTLLFKHLHSNPWHLDHDCNAEEAQVSCDFHIIYKAVVNTPTSHKDFIGFFMCQKQCLPYISWKMIYYTCN